VVAQRLLRQVCVDCAQPAEPGPHELAWLRAQVGAARASDIHFQAGAGCTYCNLSGYRGRTAIYELIEIDSTLADAIRAGDSGAFERAALAQPGYTSLTRSAIELAAAGGTTLAEVIATTSGLDFANPPTSAQNVSEDELSDALLSGRAVNP
jgi:MSHA biogenesis protein MshE